MTLRIVTLYPALNNVNGDSENASVLRRRAEWAGLEAEVVSVELGDPLPGERPDIVVIGSTVDAQLPAVQAGLVAIAAQLRSWVGEGTAVLGVGTGLELLSEGIQLPAGWLEGLSLLPGRAIPAETRVTDDLVVSTHFGRLIGFENHARDFLLPADAPAFGSVVFGRGNGGIGTAEGSASGRVYGTHLHGPVLAKNPSFADALLADALGAAYSANNELAIQADETARAARDIIARRLELEAE